MRIVKGSGTGVAAFGPSEEDYPLLERSIVPPGIITSMRTRFLALADTAGRSWIPGEPPESNDASGPCGPTSAADGSPFGSQDREADASTAFFLLVTRYRLGVGQDHADGWRHVE